MDEKTAATKDRWDKWESFAKTAAGICAAFGAILIPVFINQYTEESRKSQVYIQMMSDREKSDTTIRENMFKVLLDKYFETLKVDMKKDDLESFRKRIVFLELLTLNFQEFFNAKPLFVEVYEKLVKHRNSVKDEQARNAWMELEKKIMGVAKDTASRQATTLNTIGATFPFSISRDDVLCIRLYEKADFDTFRKRDGTTRFEQLEVGACLREREKGEVGKAGTAHSVNQDHQGDQSLAKAGYHTQQSLELRVAEVRESRVMLYVTVYTDFFDRKTYAGSELGRSFPVNVSYFDMPYMDNIKLADGNRFSLVLKEIDKGADGNEPAGADIEAIRFKNDFMSMRDRPLFEDMLKKLQQNSKTR